MYERLIMMKYWMRETNEIKINGKSIQSNIFADKIVVVKSVENINMKLLKLTLQKFKKNKLKKKKH